MRSRMISVAMIFSATASYAVGVSAEQSSAPRREIIHTRTAWLAAYAAGDEATLEQLTDKDATIVESNGNALDRAALVDRARKPPVPLTLTSNEDRVVTYGDVARINSLVVEQRGSARIEFRVSDLFVRRSGAWKLASSHWTRTGGELTETHQASPILDLMAGTYRTPRGTILTVKRQGDRLHVVEPSGATAEFVTISDSMILSPRNKVRWLFITGPDGQVTHAVIANQSILTPVTRVK